MLSGLDSTQYPSSCSLKPFIEAVCKVYEEPKGKGIGLHCLYRDRALSKVGFSYEYIEKCSLALLGLPLSLSDDVA